MLKDTRCHKKSFYPIFFVKGSNFVQYPVSFIKLTPIFSEIPSFIGYNCISLYTKIIHLWHKQLLLFITIWSTQKEKVWIIVKDEFLSQRKASQLLSHGAVPEISMYCQLSQSVNTLSQLSGKNVDHYFEFKTDCSSVQVLELLLPKCCHCLILKCISWH